MLENDGKASVALTRSGTLPLNHLSSPNIQKLSSGEYAFPHSQK